MVIESVRGQKMSHPRLPTEARPPSLSAASSETEMPISEAIISTTMTRMTSPIAQTSPRRASVPSNHKVQSAVTRARLPQRRAIMVDSVHLVPATPTHMELKARSASPLPHRHTRGILARAPLALDTILAHQKLVPNPSRHISARGRNAIWWVLIPSPSLIPIHYLSSRLSPLSPPLHHIPPIILLPPSTKHPSFPWIAILLLLLLCPRSLPCFLPRAHPSPCRPTRAMASRFTG
jgi:hypothetical protein